MGILISHTQIDATRHISSGESEVYESCCATPAEVYRHCLKNYGRCTGKVYIDKKDGKSVHVGWVFVSRQKYDDCNDTYLAETWVTMHKAKPTHTITHHYMELNP